MTAPIPRNAFHWEDPFIFEEQLTEEERLIRDSTREFCQDKLASSILEANRREEFDREILNEMGSMGMLGSVLPEEYGGSGTSYVGYGLVSREVERVDSGYRSAMSVQSSLCLLYTSPSPRD